MTQAEVVAVEFGRLVDVYGLRVTADAAVPELYRRDVVIGSNIEDQRPASSSLSDSEITYDFTNADPDTLQPRLLIPRDLTSTEFLTAFEALDDQLREVSPMMYGQGGAGLPFSVVPRNAGIRVRFSAPLGIDDSFFVERDAQGAVTGLINTEAVQLLRIVPGATQPDGFVPMPVRIAVRERELVLDPVLLGTEGLQYQTNNNASGLPASPDQSGANIRIAFALSGPLAIPRLRAGDGGLTGLNNSGVESIVRDFRSGNASDSSADLARGFVRDSLPLRVIGEIGMFLEKVESVNSSTQEITVFKNGVSHEIDRGDVFRFLGSGILGSGRTLSSEVLVDPVDDRDSPSTQHVRVRVRRIAGLEDLDPRSLPGYPTGLTEREAWLVTNAPRAICIAEYTAGSGTGRDDPNNFLTFSPQPLAVNGVRPRPNEFVSPFAGAIVRFTKPVDMSTVKWADTFFFAMRDLATSSSIEDFIASRPNNTPGGGGVGMDPAAFNLAKYRTPYLITARVFDEDGSQTAIRLQPTTGFYLDDTMRNPPAGADYRYFLHLISDSADGGIRDLAGNPLDLQGTTADLSSNVVIDFTVDTRMNGDEPLFPDNLAISLVRRFASRDEDAQPSYFLGNEVQAPGTGQTGQTFPLEDLFGGVVYLDGKLQPRPTTRTRVVVDNLNQSPIVQQPQVGDPQAPLAWCPQAVTDGTQEGQIGSNSATNVLNAGIQNPLNPYGCRLQTLWREVDLSLSRTEPFDFNLDIEQMYWAPYTQTNLTFDEFDSVSLTLGYSEYRPVPCVGDFSSLPSLPDSGLRNVFDRNFAHNPSPQGAALPIESFSPKRQVYVDPSATQGAGVPMTIDPSDVVYEPNGVNRFLPLPAFRKPYFVFRDETVIEQGGRTSDTIGADINATTNAPYILSPYAMGQGRRWLDRTNGSVAFVNSYWNDGRSLLLPPSATANPPLTGSADNFTGGLVGNVALPLLADFWTFCDRPDLPVGGGYIASGTNGWQVAITVQSDPRPSFRVLSAGRAALASGGAALCRAPGDASWTTAQGGFVGQTSQTTPAGDNTLYWIMMDVAKRQSVITNGFVDLFNPHRVPQGHPDPRLGPFFLNGANPSLPANTLPSFAYEFDPPLSSQPDGTAVVAQFRAAGAVDPNPWYWNAFMRQATPAFPAATIEEGMRTQLKPTADNFPLDPFKAGDAHMRKWDTRNTASGSPRNWWTYLYNRTVTAYVEDPNDLMDPAFTNQYASPTEAFTPRDIRYVNWRFVTSNNVDATPPVSPTIETFSLSYRFQRVQ